MLASILRSIWSGASAYPDRSSDLRSGSLLCMSLLSFWISHAHFQVATLVLDTQPMHLNNTLRQGVSGPRTLALPSNCAPSSHSSPLSACSPWLRPSQRTLASFFAYISEQLVYLDILCWGDIFHLVRKLVMSLIEPVDNTLKVDIECSTYPSEAHPFQAHLHGLCFEGGSITHRSTVGSEVTLATLTPHSFATCVIGTRPHHSF
jgi:hypothetical protein